MTDWYSEEAVQRLRFVLTSFKRFHGLSNARLAIELGNLNSGPSASTITRFLERSGGGAELSIRHSREVLNKLSDFLQKYREEPDTRAFVDSCASDLGFFNINHKVGSNLLGTDILSERAHLVKASGLSGKYLIARRLASPAMIFSLAIFLENEKLSGTIHKLSCGSSPISMKCRSYSINAMIYLEGLNQIHDTMRFLCFSKLGPNLDVGIGFMSGFESPGIPFASRSLLVKIGDDVDPFPEIKTLKEQNEISVASDVFESLAVNPGQAQEALKKCSEPSYLVGGAIYV